MFRSLPVVLIITLLLGMLLSPCLTEPLQASLYAISLTIKSGILFVLPFIIFGLLFKATIDLAESATGIIFLILIGVCSSNFLSTFLSHFVGQWVYHFNLNLINPASPNSLNPAWNFSLPPIIANNHAMFAGLGLGFLCAIFKIKVAEKVANQFSLIVTQLLKLITYLIPLFVLGFVIKLHHDGVMTIILHDYLKIFLVVAAAQYTYILFLYFLVNSLNFKKTIYAVKNMLSAAITGFCTMSSAVAMPLTIAGASRNAKNPEVTGSIVPATVNIHLMGDCFAIPIFAYAVMKSFGIADPSLLTYLTFVFYFVIAKFSVAAIPAGGIIVMLPILQSYLGFNSEMLSLITALYILFDPVITSANVLGNGAFAMLIDRVSSFLSKRYKQDIEENAAHVLQS